eukprot:11767532-Ditylum_brightwellii.AAC.1
MARQPDDGNAKQSMDCTPVTKRNTSGVQIWVQVNQVAGKDLQMALNLGEDESHVEKRITLAIESTGL